MKQPELDAHLAEQLRELHHVPSWKAFAGMSTKMMDTWKSNLLKISIGKGPMEEIAKEHIRWTAMIHGVQMVFLQMDELIQELNRREKEEEGEKNDDRDRQEKRLI